MCKPDRGYGRCDIDCASETRQQLRRPSRRMQSSTQVDAAPVKLVATGKAMQPSIFNVQVPVAERQRSVPDEHVLGRPVARVTGRGGAARADRPRRRRAFSGEERRHVDALVENGFVVDEPSARAAGARRVLLESPRGHRPAAGHGADHAAVQLRVRLLLPGRPRRLQQVRREDEPRNGGAGGRLDCAAARRGEAREVHADALRGRAAAEPAGRLLPGGAVPRDLRRSAASSRASASSPTGCFSRRRSSNG